MLIFPALHGLMVPAIIPGSVDTFNDSDSYKLVDVTKIEKNKLVGYLEIPNRAIVTNASFNVTSQLSPLDLFPNEVFIDVGDDGNYEWAFEGDGYGNLGQQQLFLTNKSDSRLKIEGDSFNNEAKIRLPKNATVTSTTMLIDGRANVSGADPAESWTKLKSHQGDKIAANITEGNIYFARYNNWQRSKFFDIYDPEKTSWSKSSNNWHEFSETGHSITLAGTEIYITTVNWTVWPNIVKLYSYGINNNTWTDHGNLPAGSNPQIGGLTYDQGDFIYLIDYFWTPSTSIGFYKYSISNGKWTTLKSPLLTETRYPTLCYLNGRVYMMNYTSFGRGTHLQYYAPNNNTWFRLESAPVGIISKICTDGFNIFGADYEGRILKYDVPSNTWAITGKRTSNFIGDVAGFAYSNRNFYLSRYRPNIGTGNGFFTMPGLGGGDFPINSTLNIGDNGGTAEWNITGEFNTTDYVDDLSAELNNLLTTLPATYIDPYGNEFVDVPINVTSNRTSEFAIRKMLINYTYTECVDLNPFYGNLVNSLNELIPDIGEGNILLPIIIYSGEDGRINISDIAIDYYIPDLTNDQLRVIDGHGPGGKIIYADYKNYTFLVNVSYLPGHTQINTVTLFLDINGEDLQLMWDEATDNFSVLRDPKKLIELDVSNCISINNSIDQWTLLFKIRFDWMYPNETLELCALNTTTDSNSWIFNYFEDIYRLENDLDLIGSLSVVGEDQGLLIEDNLNNWVHASETITWGNLKVVYEGTTDIYPDNKNFNVTIYDDDNGIWINSSSSGGNMVINTQSDADSDYFDIHRINITDIPGLGIDVSDWSFEIKTDNDIPGPTSNIRCHADTPGDPQTGADDDKTIFVTWGVASDGSGSGVVEYAMEFNNPNPTVIKDNGDTAEGMEGQSTFYVRARDKVGNWGVTGNASIFIDLSFPSFADPIPDPEAWQTNRTITCGITINDISGSGVELESVQYRYVDEGNVSNASWNPYTGPGDTSEIINCKQNITFAYDGSEKKIQWRAQDLAGNGKIYSDVFELKIDSAPPTIDYISPNFNNWQDSLSPTFSFYINDTGGSGIDVDSLRYSIAPSGNNDFGAWIYFNGIANEDSVYCNINPTFKEGKQNYIRFGAIDNAGNYIIFNPKKVKVDASGMEFINPKPVPTGWSNKQTINCKITIYDKIGAIDPLSIKYQTSTNGTKHYSYWKSISVYKTINEHTINVTAQIKLKNGINNYIRWRATDFAGHTMVSDHFNVQIDQNPITFGETIITPTEDQWFNILDVPSSISVHDISGSGVLSKSIEYSISTSGLDGFGKWTTDGLELIDLGETETSRGQDIDLGQSRAGDSDEEFVSENLLAMVISQFEVGTENYIQWRGTDLAGNNIEYSEPIQIKIDQKTVIFKNEVPQKNEIMDNPEIMCMITIEDLGGSGVDPASVEYRYSKSGLNGFSDWTNLNINKKDQSIFFVYITFGEGEINNIQWQARDLAGNNYTMSKIYNLTVNSPPLAEIKEPKNYQEFTNNDKIFFDASLTTDPDFTDELSYQWESDIIKIFGDKKKFHHSLPPGNHNITLTVYDRAGHSSEANVELVISKYIPPVKNDTGNDTQEGDPKKTKKISSDILILGGIIIIIILVLISINLVKRRKLAKAKLEAESEDLTSKIRVTSKASSEIQTTKVKDGDLTDAKEPEQIQTDATMPGQPPGFGQGMGMMPGPMGFTQPPIPIMPQQMVQVQQYPGGPQFIPHMQPMSPMPPVQPFPQSPVQPVYQPTQPIQHAGKKSKSKK
jgi:hypothetical protein